MTTGREIANCARTYIGTPFHHQGRVKGIGIDCAGLVIGVAHELGIFAFDFKEYGRQPNPRTFLALLRDHLDPATTIEAGCVLAFAFATHQQHLGIALCPYTMVHAIDQHRVHDITLTETWSRRLRGIYHYRGVTYG